MGLWVVAMVGGVILLTVAVLALVSRKMFRAVAPEGASAGFRLFPGQAVLAGMAASWEQNRAAIAAVLREDLQVLHARLASSTAGGSATDEAGDQLRTAAEAADRFAANEDWADNLRAATTAMGRANQAMTGTDRPPCLFNPVHGPAAAEVDWAPGGGTRRRVPVCADDAARLRAGSAPLVRMVPTDEGVGPYFAAHGRYVEWILGWYDGFDPYLTARLLAGTPIGSHLPGRVRAIHGTAADPLGEFGHLSD